MNEEKELNQIENDEPVNDIGLENFVELDDLQNLEGLEDLSGLGDLSDLDAQAQSSVEEMPETDNISLNHLDMPDLGDIAGIEIEEPITAESSVQDTGSAEDKSDGDEEIDSMLEGLLDSLDTNGSIDVPEYEENTSVKENINDEAELDTSVEPEIAKPVDNTETSDTIDNLEILNENVADNPDSSNQASEESISVPDSIKSDIKDIELEIDGENDSIGLDGMLDDLMMSHNPDFMDALGLDINGEAKPAKDDNEIANDADENKKKKEKKKKRLRKEKEELEERETQEKVKKIGFFKRLFGNIVTDEIAQAEQQAKIDEEEKAKTKAEEKAKALEEKKARKEQKEANKQLKKEEKEIKKAKKAEEKAAKKAEKAAKRAEQKELEEKEVVGKLNKAGVTVVIVGAALLLASVVLGTNIFGYRLTKSETEKYFKLKKYSEAYKEAIGSKLKDKDSDEYDKIITVMKVQQSLDSYNNYTAMKYYPDALNALLRGLEKYDENIETARDLEVDSDLEVCKDKILGILKDEFGLSKSQAYAILKLDNELYTNRVVSIAKKKI